MRPFTCAIKLSKLLGLMDTSKKPGKTWISQNKYILSFTFMFIIVLLMVLSYMKGI